MPEAAASDTPGKAAPVVGGRLETRLAAGSFASLVSLLFGIGTAIVQVPLLLAAWGEETYGAWLLVSAAYSLIISLDLGHQNYVANKISMLGLHDVAACRRVLGSAVKAACIIGMAEVAAAVAVAWSGLFSVWLPGEQASVHAIRVQAAVSLIVQTLFFATAGSIGGILVRLYVAGGLYARAQWLGVAQRFAMFVGLVGAAACGFSMGLATCSYVLAGASVCIYTFWDLRKSFPEYWPWWSTGSLSMGLRQAVSSLGLTATSVSDQCAAAGFLAISGSRTHASGVATLGTLRTLSNSILQAAGVLVLPVLPDLSRFAASADHGKANAALAALWLISTAPLSVAVTLLGPFVGDFFRWWTRGALTFSAPLFALLVCSTLVRQWQSPMALFLFSANRVRAQLVISLLRAGALFLALAVGFYFFSDVSVAGVAIVVSELVGAGATAVCTQLFLNELRGSLPVASAGLGAIQVGIYACGATFSMVDPESQNLVITACVLAHLAVVFFQWRYLPVEVKDRTRHVMGIGFSCSR